MSSILVRPRDQAERARFAVTPERAGWRYVGFEALRLSAGERIERQSGDRELCVVWLAGSADVRCGDDHWRVAGRPDPFAGPPDAVYIPAGSLLKVAAVDGSAEIVIGSAPARDDTARRARAGEAGRATIRPRHLPAREARRELRGSGAMERTIYQILMEDREAERLLVTEVVTPAGHWSSYPPHKHDTDDPPRETALEEIYYFRLRDPRGFALERVYTPDRSLDETVAATDGDLVLVPRGYHTVSAAPGYETYYLNVMAGPRREWKITFDPDHERMKW